MRTINSYPREVWEATWRGLPTKTSRDLQTHGPWLDPKPTSASRSSRRKSPSRSPSLRRRRTPSWRSLTFSGHKIRIRRIRLYFTMTKFLLWFWSAIMFHNLLILVLHCLDKKNQHWHPYLGNFPNWQLSKLYIHFEAWFEDLNDFEWVLPSVICNMMTINVVIIEL